MTQSCRPRGWLARAALLMSLLAGPALACDLCFGPPSPLKPNLNEAIGVAKAESRLVLAWVSSRAGTLPEWVLAPDRPEQLIDDFTFELTLVALLPSEVQEELGTLDGPKVDRWLLLDARRKRVATTSAVEVDSAVALAAWLEPMLSDSASLARAAQALEQLPQGTLWPMERWALAQRRRGLEAEYLAGLRRCVLEGLSEDQRSAPRRRRALMRRVVRAAEVSDVGRASMEQLGAELIDRAFTGRDHPNAARDLVAFNRARDAHAANLEAYEQLPRSQKRIRRWLRGALLPELVEAGRYAEALRGILPAVDFRNQTRAVRPGRGAVRGSAVAKYERGTVEFVERRTEALITALSKTDRMDEAEALRAQLATFVAKHRNAAETPASDATTPS